MGSCPSAIRATQNNLDEAGQALRMGLRFKVSAPWHGTLRVLWRPNGRHYNGTVGLLQRHVSQGGQIIRKLLEKPLLCEVIEQGGLRGYRITGQGNYLPLLQDNRCSNEGGVPNGIYHMVKLVHSPLLFRRSSPYPSRLN